MYHLTLHVKACLKHLRGQSFHELRVYEIEEKNTHEESNSENVIMPRQKSLTDINLHFLDNNTFLRQKICSDWTLPYSERGTLNVLSHVEALVL